MCCLLLDPATLWRAAAVVRDGRHVGDGGDFKARGLKRSNCLLATGTRALHENLDLAHTVLHRLARGAFSGLRSRVWRALARAFEAGDAAGAPRNHAAGQIRQRDDRVIEAGLDVRMAHRHVLLLSPACLRLLLAFRHRCCCVPLLLAPDADRALRSAALACIGLGALAARGEVAPMAQPAVRADLLQSLDIQRDLAAQVTLDLVAPIDDLAQAV